MYVPNFKDFYFLPFTPVLASDRKELMRETDVIDRETEGEIKWVIGLEWNDGPAPGWKVIVYALLPGYSFWEKPPLYLTEPLTYAEAVDRVKILESFGRNGTLMHFILEGSGSCH